MLFPRLPFISLLILTTSCHLTQAFHHPTPLRMSSSRSPSSSPFTNKRLLVIGGTGRVGGSTVRALRKLDLDRSCTINVGGRNEGTFSMARERWVELEKNKDSYSDVGFLALDHEDPVTLQATLAAYRPDLIIHTAGPFQRRKAPEVLKAALALHVPYVDVCDDIDLSQIAKSYDQQAKEAGVPCLISTGVWPGVSSLMAVDVAEALGGADKTDSIEFDFYTAGSGGAGTTILSATFLILSEKALAFVNGKPTYYPAASDFKEADFGDVLGDRQVFRMNLLEAYSCHKLLGVPNVCTFFGTEPGYWNYLLYFISLLPVKLLRDRKAMQTLALVSEPVVRLVDKLVGSTNAMRVVGKGKDGKSTASALYAHVDLETCVGEGIAAFAVQLLEGKIAPGVYYPEEAFAEPAARDAVLELATRGCFAWERPLSVVVKKGQEGELEREKTRVVGSASEL